MAKEGAYAQVRLPSGEVRMVLQECRATIGQLGNIEQIIVRVGKAGKSRWLGIRPTVRGLAMNPVDHPHGGGEGKSGRAIRTRSRPGARRPRAQDPQQQPHRQVHRHPAQPGVRSSSS